MDNRRSSRPPSTGRNTGSAEKRFGGRDHRSPTGPKSGQDRSARRPSTDDGRRTPFWKRSSDAAKGDARSGGFGARPDGKRGGQKHSRTSGPQERSTPEVKITSDLQLTDGRYRARLLSNSLRPTASPTPRKLREVTFKVVSRRVKARRFLDLGCGCGTVGLEAISRGAMLATFVERSARMQSLLEKNVEALGIKDGHAEVCGSEIVPFLKAAAARRRHWDLVFLGTRDGEPDPEIFSFLSRGTAVSHGGLLLIEHSADREFPETLGTLRRWRVIKNEDVAVTIFERT